MSDTSSPAQRESVWPAIILVAVVLVIGLVAWIVWPRDYGFVAEAKILVVPKRAPVGAVQAGGAMNPYIEDFMATHLVLIRSPIIIERAIKRGQLTDLASIGHPADPVAAIGAMLSASNLQGAAPSNVIELRCCGPNANDCQAIVTAIVDSYQEFLDITYGNVSTQTTEIIHRARETLRTDVQRAEAKLHQFRKQQSQSRAASRNAINLQLQSLEQKVAEAAIRRAEIGAELTYATANGDSLRNQLRAQEWAAKIGWNNLSDDVRKATSVTASYKEHLRGQLDALGVLDATLEKLIARENAALLDAERHEYEEGQLRNELARQTQIYEATIKRLQEMNLVRDSVGFDARIISPPESRPATASDLRATKRR